MPPLLLPMGKTKALLRNNMEAGAYQMIVFKTVNFSLSPGTLQCGLQMAFSVFWCIIQHTKANLLTLFSLHLSVICSLLTVSHRRETK